MSLRFVEADHRYYWNEDVVPSVTQVMADQGLGSPPGPWFKPEHRARGRAVHLACTWVADDSYDQEGTDPVIHGFVSGYQQFLKDTGFRPELLEEPMFSPSLKVAGTMDQWGKAPSGETWLVDIKTGVVPKLVGVQLAFYGYMLAEERGLQSAKRKALRLEASGKYTIVDCSEPRWTKYAMEAVSQWRLRKDAGLIKGDDSDYDDRND